MGIRKLGSNLNVKGMVIHRLNKTAGNRNVGFKKASKVFTISEREQTFLGSLYESYNKKSNPTYGIFGGGRPEFKSLLHEYISNNQFYDFTITAASHYKIILENTPNATGGFLIFTDFLNTDNSNRYLLILTITNKDGFVVNEDDLTIKDIKNLDLSKVDVACMINLSAWNNIENENDTESKTYLSFVGGRKGISYYFMDFIDCDNKTTNTESTRRLTNALTDYFETNKYDKKKKLTARNTVYEYCTTCIKEKKPIHLSAISNLLDPNNPEAFQQFASSEEYGVSETIKGDRKQLRRIKYIKYVGEGEKYTIEFDESLLNKEVFYNKQKKELTFKNIPEDYANQMNS